VTENFKTLSTMRLTEARALFDASCWSGSYYLAGYSVECALKARILKSVKRYHMPDKLLIDKSHTHDLTDLVKLAGLVSDLASRSANDHSFAANWATVKDWNESSRYKSWTTQEADDILQAITQRGSGVLSWIKKHW
jgi:hypothetical protein